MSQKSFGDITLAEYQRIVEGSASTGASPSGPAGPPGRFLWLRRAGLLAGVLVTALFCSAVGDYFGPWSGKSAKDLSYSQAIEILRQQGPEGWVTELGIGATTNHVLVALAELHAIARAQPEMAEKNVGAGFAQIGLLAIEKLQELGDVGDYPSQHNRQLETLERVITSK